MTSGTVKGTIYGGSNEKGTINKNSYIFIYGGTIGVEANKETSDAIFGGGKGKETVGDNKDNSLERNANVIIEDRSENINIYGDIYAGSALGAVKEDSNVEIRDCVNPDYTINFSNTIFGGGKGLSNGTNNYSAISGGNVNVLVDGGNFENASVFGGCNIYGKISGNVLVQIGKSFSTILNEVYGGGKKATLNSDADSDYVYLYNKATVNNSYNGGMNAGIEGSTEQTPRGIYANGATINNNIYGGSNFSGSLDNTFVYCQQGTQVKGNVYGGGFGESAQVTGSTNVLVTSVKADNSISSPKTKVYGDVFGGGDSAPVTDNSKIDIISSEVEGNVFGGGNAAALSDSSNITITESNINKVFGGGNNGTLANIATLKINSSTINMIYGGGNAGAILNGYVDLDIENSTINTIYGGGKSASVGGNDATKVDGSGCKTNLNIINCEIKENIFGGGEGSTAEVNGSTLVSLENSKLTGTNSADVLKGNIFGGGNNGKVTKNTAIRLNASKISESVFGGGNAADVEGYTTVDYVNVSSSKNVYGGGNNGAVSGTSGVLISESSTVSNNAYGGGCNKNVIGSTTLTVDSSTVGGNVYGGGEAANVNSTGVFVQNNSIAGNIYGGGDQGEIINNTRVKVSDTQVVGNTLDGEDGKGKIYGGGRGAATVSTTIPGKVGTSTETEIKNTNINGSVFGGGKGISALVGENTQVVLENSVVGEDIYGGGDNGYVNQNTSVALKSSTINGSAYGAGNGESAVVRKKSYIYSEGTTNIKGNLFGSGNAAPTGVKENNINNTLADKLAAEKQKADSVVDVSGGIINGNVYGGANSSVVYGDVAVNIGKKAIDDYYDSIPSENPKDYKKGNIEIKDTIFGGGEQMDPTKEFNFYTVSVEGFIDINIDGEGYDTHTGTDDYTIYIGENVFGSGHASRAGLHRDILDSVGLLPANTPPASGGDDEYKDYITLNADVSIKNYGTVDDIKEAVSLQRCSDLVLDKVYMAIAGTFDSTSLHPVEDYTLNQIKALILKNGTILYLRHGANLVESFYSKFNDSSDGNAEKLVTVDVVNEVTDTEGKKYEVIGDKATRAFKDYIISSGLIFEATSDGNKGEKVGEVDSVATKRVRADADNRIYMYSGINLNISSSEKLEPDEFGPVKGMTFFGIYTPGIEGVDPDKYNEGMFERNYSNGINIQWAERNYTHCYAQGRHVKSPEQDITKDGFYTMFEQFTRDYAIDEVVDETNYEAYSYTNYITPTPAEENYYMWYAGPDAETYYFPITLIASKYSTQGATTLNLSEINFENATFEIKDVFSELEEGIEIIDSNSIPNINPNQDEADSLYGLEMKTGNNAWSMNGETQFHAEPSNGGNFYTGTSVYKTENSKTTPSLSFYLSHSNNISKNVKENLGYYTITMRLMYYKDALNKATANVIIEVTLKSKYYDDLGYDASITPGRQYSLFPRSTTNITTKSSFTTYFELAINNFKGEESNIRKFYTPGDGDTVPTGYDVNTKLTNFYSDNYREIEVDYAFPEDTTITMIDRSKADSPKYYYYRVSSADAGNKKVFRLNEFLKMGSTDEYYTDDLRNQYYTDSDGLDYHYECFIFIVDFESAKFVDINDRYEIVSDQTISMSLRSNTENYNGEKFRVTLLDEYINARSIKFGIYNTDPTIKIDAELSKNKIYVGTPTDLEVTTNYVVNPNDNGSTVTVYDTRYFDKKQGVKITIFNEEGEIVKGASLLGVYFEVTDSIGNVERYYPRTDGTTRVKVADKVSNSKSKISIRTENSSIPTGSYDILVESFASADGIYFGVEASDSARVHLDIVNDMYGLDSTLPEEQVIIDKDTGYTLEKDTGYVSNGDNKLNLNVKYNSGLTDPYIVVSLYRRDYDNPYDRTYSLVDLQDYVEETLVEIPNELKAEYTYNIVNEDGTSTVKNGGYLAFDKETLLEKAPDISTIADLPFDLTLKNNLKTGTYKVTFKLYDKNISTVYDEIDDGAGGITSVPREVTEYQLIGDTFSYIIIK